MARGDVTKMVTLFSKVGGSTWKGFGTRLGYNEQKKRSSKNQQQFFEGKYFLDEDVAVFMAYPDSLPSPYGRISTVGVP